MTKELSEKTLATLMAIIDAPGKTAVDIAAIQSVSLGAVTGAISSLKKAELITVEDGKLTPTDEAHFAYGAGNAEAVPASATIAKVGVTTDDVDTTNLDPAVSTETETVSPLLVQEKIAAVDAIAIGQKALSVGDAIMGAIATPAAAPTTPVVATVSKAAKARAIFDANKDQPRKVLMALMMAPEVGLTQHGANTYIYNFRKADGMVTERTATTTITAPAVAETPAFIAEAPEAVIVDVMASIAATTEVAFDTTEIAE